MTEQDTTETVWLTQDAYDKLAAELEDLKGPKRAEIVERISTARDEGDLKENAGYHAARDEQGKLEGRIKQLEDMLRRAEVGEAHESTEVEPGSVVTYRFEGADDTDKFLLGAREIAPDDLQVFSPQSPLGGAVLGAKKGETVSYEAPNGKTIKVVVEDFEPFTG